jgi:hypothetical protein
MRRRTPLLIAAVILFVVGWPAHLSAQATPAAPVQIQKIVFSTVAEWERSARRDGLQVTNNADGELRLADTGAQLRRADGTVEGIFESEVISTTATFSAIGAVWRADVPPGTELLLEVRGGATRETLGSYRLLPGGDAHPQEDGDAIATEAVVSFPAGSGVLQLRATLRASPQAPNASPLLSDITISAIDASAGPPQVLGLPLTSPIYGPATLTAPPQLVARYSWSGGTPPAVRGARRAPQSILLHQIGDNSVENPLPFLRATLAYQQQVLEWDDTPFHFVIDRDGNIYEGRSGGPASVVPRLAGGLTAVHVALIGDGAPPALQRTALSRLLAWLGEAYAIAPLGQRSVNIGGTAIVVPNVATHAEVVPEAADPSSALNDLIAELRTEADEVTVRSRWYFAEGNVFDFAQRLAVVNPGATTARVRYVLLRQPGPPVIREATIAPGARADLVVNEIFSDTTELPSYIESNAPVIAERFMSYSDTDLSVGPGIERPSRVWYFAEGSTIDGTRTYLVLFNPQPVEVSAVVTYVQDDGTTLQPREPVRIPPLERRVVVVGDQLADAGFGARVIASQPIVAERTMLFGGDDSGGVHVAPGVAELSRRWYFAEGTTQPPFQMSIMVLNPNAQNAEVAVTFMTSDGTSLTRRYAMPPTSRLAINVNEVVPELGVATTVESDRPVVAERALYWRGGAAGTAGPGAMAPSYTWRFADGRTSDGFQEYLLLSNPNKNQTRVTVDVVLNDGAARSQTIVMPGRSRYTMALHELYPGQRAISATVRATQPVVAERSIYAGPPDVATSRGGTTALGIPEVSR